MLPESPAFRAVVRSTVVTCVGVVIGTALVAASFLDPWCLFVLAFYVPLQVWLIPSMWKSTVSMWNLEKRGVRFETLVEVNEILLENTRTPLD